MVDPIVVDVGLVFELETLIDVGAVLVDEAF